MCYTNCRFFRPSVRTWYIGTFLTIRYALCHAQTPCHYDLHFNLSVTNHEKYFLTLSGWKVWFIKWSSVRRFVCPLLTS